MNNPTLLEMRKQINAWREADNWSVAEHYQAASMYRERRWLLRLAEERVRQLEVEAAEPRCECGHLKNDHMRALRICKSLYCPCEQFRQAVQAEGR